MWDPSVRQLCRDRVDRLTPTAAPQWGKLTVAGMLAHLNDSYRMATGELAVKGKWLPFRYPPLRQMVVYLIPIPKGAPTAPEMIARCGQAEFETEREAFRGWMDRFGRMTPDTPLTPHPAFGHLSHKEYGVLMARHADHHLRQFGV
jgi:Protein of unknown function (DUF1569)